MRALRERPSRSGGRRLLDARVLLILVPALLGQTPQGPAGKGDRAMLGKHEQLVKLYTGDAEAYTIFRDASRREKLELRQKPVYVWTNPLRAGGQDGAVFVWTCRGRAELLGTFFSYPAKGERGFSTSCTRSPQRCSTSRGRNRRDQPARRGRQRCRGSR